MLIDLDITLFTNCDKNVFRDLNCIYTRLKESCFKKKYYKFSNIIIITIITILSLQLRIINIIIKLNMRDNIINKRDIKNNKKD